VGNVGFLKIICSMPVAACSTATGFFRWAIVLPALDRFKGAV
jgi:hypothetical protein